MKKFFSFIISFILILSFSLGYVIEKDENIEAPPGLDGSTTCYVPISSYDFTYNVPSDNGTTKKYVESYVVGGRTALQVCSIGNTSGCTHEIKAPEGDLYVQYQKSEIIEVTKPTCLENGSMTIKCKNKVTSGWGIFSSEKECGKTGTIILEKTGHTISEHSVDGRCERCNEIHSKKELLINQVDEENHYYSCSFEGCTEKIEEAHDFKQDPNTKKWICSVCNFEDSSHKASSEWSGDEKRHYKKCVVDGCNETFEEGDHIGGKHPDGICSECHKKYQTHNMDTSKFSSDENGHTYGCSYEGCEETFSSSHEKGNDISWDGKTHWYNCTNEDCDKRFEELAHSDEGNGDGVCTVCKRKYDGELESFKIKNITNDSINFDEIGDNIKLEIEYSPDNLADTEFTWEIDDEDIATVTQDGVVTAISEGVTILHVYWKDEEITCTIYVTMETFEIEAEDDEIFEGSDHGTQLRVVTKNIDENDIEWSTDPKRLAWISDKLELIGNTNVADVNGEIVTVWAKLSNGLVARTEVKIKHLGGASHENGGKCKCGMVIEKHDLSNTYSYDEETHWKTCSNSKCKDKHYEEFSHTSNTECTECDWKKDSSSSGGSGSGGSGSGGSGSGGSGSGGSGSGGSGSGGSGSGGSGSGGSSSGGSGSGGSSSGGSGSEEDNALEWKWNEKEHWKVNAKGERVGDAELHKFMNGKCECGKEEVTVENCNHKLKGEFYVTNPDGVTHSVYCNFCEKFIRPENCTKPVESCKCRKGLKEVETDLDIPIKVYYIDENGLYSAEEYTKPEGEKETTKINLNIISRNKPPQFSWTMSTMPGKTFYSENNDVADDKTICVWYDGNDFCAKLSDSGEAALSEELKVKITLLDGGSKDFDEIKIIKNGPPSSYCQIYMDRQYIVKGESKLNLLIKTKYNDFTDEEVRSLRGNFSTENEFPFYTVKGGKITIKSEKGDILKVESVSNPKEVTDKTFNGYIAEVSVSTEKVGTEKINIELTTEYTISGCKVIEKERKGSMIIHVVEKAEDIPLGKSTEKEMDSDEESMLGSIILASVGALALLLIAIVGSKMSSHR